MPVQPTLAVAQSSGEGTPRSARFAANHCRRDWSASAVYVGSPQSDQKEDFLTHMVPYVIRNFDSFDPADLSDFVAAVRAAEGDRP